MEDQNSNADDDNGEELTTKQMKIKAEEIGKRFEKYQGRYQTSSSRCNTPLPFTSTDSVESIHSNITSDSSEKVLLFRQFLENDRKLVENSKIDEQSYSNNDQAQDSMLLDAQNENKKINTKFYENIIETQLQEKNINLLKNQIIELNEKLENYHNIINEKDILLKSKIDKIEVLNKVIMQKNKLHLETTESLNKRNLEVINEERLRCNQKINQIAEESADLKKDLESVHRLCDKLKRTNIKFEKENNELRKKENSLKLEIEKLNMNHENEKKLLLENSQKQIVDDMKKEFQNLQEKNNALLKHIELMESQPINTQEKDNLLTQLNEKESEIQQLKIENEKLNEDLKKQVIEVQQTANRWTQLKDAYLNDKGRMNLLENVIEELKINNNELNNTNIKLTERIEELMESITISTSEINMHKERNTDLMSVIENMRETFEKAMKESSIEYEQEKKQLIQQHEHDKNALTICNNKFNESTSKLNDVTNQLDIVMKENDSYKCEILELNNCLNKNESKILELNNMISELHMQTIQMNNELAFLKKENHTLSDKLNGSVFENEENKLLSDRFHKQKQLLKLKVKALKETENNCLLLQQQVESLTKEIQISNQKSEHLVHNNKQINSVVQYCDLELQKCYELLNKMITKSNLQNRSINTLRSVLISMGSLFSFDDSNIKFGADLLNTVDSICNTVYDDNELHICVKKIILGSINVLEYIINLNNIHRYSKAQLIARTEVEKLISEAVEKVKLSTQNEYHEKNNELLNLIECLKNDNDTLKLKIPSSISLENKKVITDLNGPTLDNLLSLKNSNIINIKDENDKIKRCLRSISTKLGLISIDETNGVLLQNSLNELELFIKKIKNENDVLKNQHIEIQKSISMTTVEKPTEKFKLNVQNAITQTEHFENNIDGEKLSLSTEDLCNKEIQFIEKSNPTKDSVVNGNSKMLLVRYKNLKSRFKEVRAKTDELDKKIVSLTNDLEFANSRYKQLNDKFIDANEIHETDIANCQSEIENLISEKLETYRQLTEIKEKHEILQNDYDQLKSNLDNETTPNLSKQNTVLKGKLNETQHLIDLAHSKIICEWPSNDANFDWVVVQSKKLNKIVKANCVPVINSENDSEDFLEESKIMRLQTCIQVIHELVTFLLTNKYFNELTSTNLLFIKFVNLISELQSLTETLLEYMSIKNNEMYLVDERHIELSHNVDNHDINIDSSNMLASSEKSSINKPSVLIQETIPEREDNEQFQRAIAERDRLIQFLSEKISKLDNLNRNVEDIRLVQKKLDKALTAVHERDVRCDELTLELTRLLEERDMLQLKLSNSIRQIQFLSDSKSQIGSSDSLKENYGSKAIDDKLEELHSLEYRKDADLFTDQEQRHKSQMQLHQSDQDGSKTHKTKSSNITEETSTSLSWIKDILW
ncbi:interaptin-like [Sipha flava]|uniref:Interaptin-like n=1 Tax=Sipha flava TaxID=143950 RepID=A0A8B8G2C6_9HEMI|nr:interaptin-like [Sipha flava]